MIATLQFTVGWWQPAAFVIGILIAAWFAAGPMHPPEDGE